MLKIISNKLPFKGIKDLIDLDEAMDNDWPDVGPVEIGIPSAPFLNSEDTAQMDVAALLQYHKALQETIAIVRQEIQQRN